jgi:N-acyl-L-homoserine lactone synthetase
MGIKIKIARDPKEIDGIFKARYKVFAEEEGKFPNRPDKRVFDHYDALPTTRNIVAVVGDKVVGGMRITENSKAGMPSEHYFDFSPYLDENATHLASTSMFCLQRDFRAMRKIAFMILCMSCYWGIRRGITHVVAPINPAIAPLIQMVGFKPVSDIVKHPASGMDILPMVLDMKNMQDTFLEYAKNQHMDEWLESFDREFFKAGEKIINYGDDADCAYIVVEGELEVSVPQESTNEELAITKMGRGELIGELALLIDSKRTANITAVTDCDLMVLDRETFQTQIMGDPKHAKTALSILGRRLANANDVLHKQT